MKCESSAVMVKVNTWIWPFHSDLCQHFQSSKFNLRDNWDALQESLGRVEREVQSLRKQSEEKDVTLLKYKRTQKVYVKGSVKSYQDNFWEF